MNVRPEIGAVTERIVERSRPSREKYLSMVDELAAQGPHRTALSCSNLAHGFAACGPAEKEKLAGDTTPNLGIITAYNDMLSAHQPYERFPDQIKEAARAAASGPAGAASTRFCASRRTQPIRNTGPKNRTKPSHRRA